MENPGARHAETVSTVSRFNGTAPAEIRRDLVESPPARHEG